MYRTIILIALFTLCLPAQAQAECGSTGPYGCQPTYQGLQSRLDNKYGRGTEGNYWRKKDEQNWGLYTERNNQHQQRQIELDRYYDQELRNIERRQREAQSFACSLNPESVGC